MPSVAIVLEDRAALSRLTLAEMPRGGLFVSGSYGLGAGAKLSVDVVLGDVGMLQFDAVVRWRRPRGSPALPAGLAVEFIHERAAAVLTDIIEGRRAPMRQSRRFRVAIPAHLHFDGVATQAVTGNISRGGAYVMVRGVEPNRRIAELHLAPPGVPEAVSPVEICSSGSGGVGVRFLGRDHRDVRLLVEEVARLSAAAATSG
jgi:Tfp pilus assembly protein PilZ